jgi:DNA repair exonuclease SbcCD nuclease subunit
MITVAHLSDIQVRSYVRHEEFKKHFENLYLSLDEKKPDYIVITGDGSRSSKNKRKQ